MKSKFSIEFALFKHGKKNKLQSSSVLISEIVTFMFKKKFSINFPQNASKQQKGIV